MQADFGFRYEPEIDFLHLRGGKVISNNQGCGNINSGEALYFFDVGILIFSVLKIPVFISNILRGTRNLSFVSGKNN